MSKLLTTAASAAILFAAAGAYAHDSRTHDNHNTGQYSHSNAAIQKGQSASTKAYGYDKQGDHYSAKNAYRDRWNESNNLYPGHRAAYGAHNGVVIKKGGSGIADASTEATTRQYGTYWN